MKFELCTDSVEGAIMASQYNFNSIELCSALSVGGLTPSLGMIKSCVDNTTAEVHAMIRHKEGEFTCTEKDIELMMLDISGVHQAGGRGVVFGILDDDSGISKYNSELLRHARSLGLQSTFHRAFDFCRDPESSIKLLIEMGFDRLLTSGLKPKAIDGIELLAGLQADYGSDIQIVAGSGVNENNALQFQQAGLNYIHFTARKAKKEMMSLGMGQFQHTDATKINKVMSLFS